MTEQWQKEWEDKDYEWPVVARPDANIVEQLGKTVIARGGRAVKEAHADRNVTLDFPNPAFPETKIRKQVPRSECRRRAQVVIPRPDEGEPIKVCVVCDSMHLWPSVQ